MGGVLLSDGHPPLLWRAPFPEHIQREVVSRDNPHGRLTNSDLEQAGVAAQAIIATQEYDLQERTLAILCDNTPAVSRFRKGSVTTDKAAAYLCRQACLHQRANRFYPRGFLHPGVSQRHGG